MFWNRPVRTLVDVERSAFNISVWTESMPATLPVFMDFIALSTSSKVGGLILMFKVSVTGEG